jgi:acetyl esterase/lipase
MLIGLLVAVASFLPAVASAQDSFDRKEDVIYGRKFGTALTLDVITPKENANGIGLVWVISGGWFSAREGIRPQNAGEFLKRGYTIFAVVHGSQPKFTIPECIADMNRAVRWIRTHAATYKVDPEKLGVYGASAGGHLSLMLGAGGSAGNEKSKDAVERAGSRVQAVACFFPPTDFLNYGEPGKVALGRGTLSNFKAPFDFHEFDAKTRAFVQVTDEMKVLELGRLISPINHVNAQTAPTLIVHGDADKLVPIQQAEVIIEKMKAAGVPCELVVKKGAAHGWPGMDKDLITLADWFDKYLRKGGK